MVRYHSTGIGTSTSSGLCLAQSHISLLLSSLIAVLLIVPVDVLSLDRLILEQLSVQLRLQRRQRASDLQVSLRWQLAQGLRLDSRRKNFGPITTDLEQRGDLEVLVEVA